MRRRELLAGLTGLAGALLLPLPGTPAGPGTRPARQQPGSNPDRPQRRCRPGIRPRPAKKPHHGVASVRDLPLSGPRRATARPGRRRGCEPGQRHRPTRQAFSAILADAYVLASELALKANEDGIAWVAADRALPAARDSGDPAAIAAASRAVAMAMRRQGHYDGATAMLTSTALTLGPATATPRPASLPPTDRCCAPPPTPAHRTGTSRRHPT